jgi:hypothetical protein
MRRCAFCPAEQGKFSREHIWDDWLNRAVPGHRYRSRHKLSLESELIEFDSNKINLKIPGVCSECNSGWMSRLGQLFKDVFLYALRDGVSISLLPSGLKILSAYTFLKAAVVDYTYSGGQPFFSEFVRECFRTSLDLPHGAQIWVGAFQGDSAFSLRCNISRYEPTGPGPLSGAEWLDFTYVVGHLVLQLLVPRWKHVHHRVRRLPVLRPKPYWDDATILIFPVDGFPVSWPPSGYLADDSLGAFTYRFQTDANLSVLL